MDFATKFCRLCHFTGVSDIGILSVARHDTRGLRTLGGALNLDGAVNRTYLEDPISNMVPNEDLVSGIAWTVPFIITVILWFILASLMSPGLKKAGLGALDRWLGVVFGFVRGLFMVTAIYIGVVIGLGGEDNLPTAATEAQSANVIRAIGEVIQPILPADLAEQLQEGLKKADIDALTPTQPEFIENGLDTVGEKTNERLQSLELLSDEQISNR